MNNVARSVWMAERALGLDSLCINSFEDSDWDAALDADVHVAHTWFPELYKGKSFRRQLTKPLRVVFVGHGTPEHVFNESVEGAKHNVPGDGWMLYLEWLKRAHARVTFWPRHAAILQTMVDTGTIVDCIPLGVDREFWATSSSAAKKPGSPALWSGENPHAIKAPLDLILAWPLVYPELDGASLYLDYMVTNSHRQYAPLINRNGAGYGMHWSSIKWGHEVLRTLLQSIDFFIGLVKYGDHNMLSLQANAVGARSISYPGNPYSDFWVHEGDHRMLARDLIAILKGDTKPREKEMVPDVRETAAAMIPIYERILAKETWAGFTPTKVVQSGYDLGLVAPAPVKPAAKTKRKARRRR